VTTFRAETYQEIETFTVCVPRTVTSTRTVTTCRPETYQEIETFTICVPVPVQRQEAVQVCRMVPRTVTVQVPAPAPCAPPTPAQGDCH
jgi:hypothetical protein